MIVLTLIGLGGCGADFKDLGREPTMSPVGSGLKTAPDAYSNQFFPPPRRQKDQSLWDGSRADLFADPRAKKVGDVVTVNYRDQRQRDIRQYDRPIDKYLGSVGIQLQFQQRTAVE